MPCQTPFRDDSAQVLLFKIASCIEAGGGGGGVAGVTSFNLRTGVVTLTAGDVSTALGCVPACANNVVTSFNGRQGVVTLTSGDVTTALGFTPLNTTTGDARYVLKSGDSMTGALSINNGVLVADAPALILGQTWNNAAAVFTGFRSNVTATAAAASSLLFDFQQNATSVLNLNTNGRLLLNGAAAFISVNSVGHSLNTSDALNTAVVNVLTVGHQLSAGVGAAGLGARIDVVGDSATVASQTLLRIDSFWIDPVQATRTAAANFILPVSGTSQIILTLTNNQAQLRDGTAALPALTFQSDPDTGIYRIGANTLGFSTAGALALTVDATGITIPAAGAITWTSRGTISRPSDGVQLLRDTAGTSFGRLQFGGTTSAFPSIKRVGATLEFRLADDSTYATAIGATLQGMTGLRASGGLGLKLDAGAVAGVFILQAGDGIATLLDGTTAATFNRLQFGGTTSAFPSIKRSAATLQFRLADDSAFAGIATAAIVMSTAAPLSFTSGANTRAGNAVLVAGTVTVANTSVTANTIVIVTRKTVGGTIGFAVTYTVIAATSFTLTSDSALDTSTYSYILIENP